MFDEGSLHLEQQTGLNWYSFFFSRRQAGVRPTMYVEHCSWLFSGGTYGIAHLNGQYNFPASSNTQAVL